jgi:hypothetical protein
MTTALLVAPVELTPVTAVADASETVAKADAGPYRQWNPSAIACYLRKANCEGCFYNGFFDDKAYGCNMADAVQHLLRRVGPPEARHLKRCI